MNVRLRLVLISLAFNGYWTLAAVQQQNASLILWLVALLALAVNFRRQGVAIIVMTVVGLAIDWCWIKSGVLQFSGSNSLPSWLIALWLTFSIWWRWLLAQINWSLSLIALFAAVGGPLSYWTASHIHQAVSFNISLIPAMLLLAIGWAIYLPLASLGNRS